MSEKSSIHSHHSQSDQQGSFLNGFTLGLFAGAAGYFLFGTSKGNEIRTKITKEWQEAQKDILGSTEITQDGSQTLMGIRQFIGSIIDAAYSDADKPISTDSRSSTKKSTSKPAKTTKKRLFRNTV